MSSTPMDARRQPDEADLRSRRFVTQGYENALHRMYLYGLGLREAELSQPLVGLAVGDNEGLAIHAAISDIKDRAATACWQANLTPMEFVVPVTAGTSDWQATVAERELVADSSELVVRGHWYDALVGVAGGTPALAGLAMALVRLRLPGRLLVPAEASDGPDEMVAALVDLGLAEVIGPRSGSEGIAISLADLASTPSADQRVRAAVEDPAGLRLPGLGTEALGHLAAVLWEAGIERLDALVDVSVLSVSGPEGEVLAVGRPDLPTGTLPVVIDGELVELQAGGSSYRVAAVDRPRPDGWAVLMAPDGLELLRRTSAPVSARSLSGPAAVEALERTSLLAAATLGAVEHPGDRDGPLRYHHL